MGEQEFFFSSNPVYIVIMRNSRGKLFAYVAAFGVVCFIMFLLSSTHTSLKELENVNEKCQQQRDSLSAQLQVVYEHKNRLEKSLQQEKTDHRHSNEAHEKQATDFETKIQLEKVERLKLETQILQLKTSYSELEEEKAQLEISLKQQLKTVQSQKDSEIEKLQTHISELLSEKDKLEVSNNAFVWKLEQHTSDTNLCHLQLKQTQDELHSCQAQHKLHNVNTQMSSVKDAEGALKGKDLPVQDAQETVSSTAKTNLLDDNAAALPVGKKAAKNNEDTTPKKSTPTAPHDKLLEKPHQMPHNLGDGVLPKPPDNANKDIDAAVEVTDGKNLNLHKDPAAQNMIGEDNLANGEARLGNLNPPMKDQEAHPQVAAPNFENVDEKDNHAAERGEDGNQYANPDLRQQVENPVLGKPNAHPKEALPVQENNDIMAQMHDMMNKSPGEVNNGVDQNVLGMPPHFDTKNNKDQAFRNGFIHRGADGHHPVEDKNYEEDDDDRENDDEPLNALAPAMKLNNNLLDNDFDDQENQDNADNAKEEEGVVVAPK